jgi:polyisoprenoid-binding protein YceI
MRSGWIKGAVGAVLAVVVLVTAGTWAYINVVRPDAPDRLTLDEGDGRAGDGSAATTTAGAFDGTWKVAPGSEAGYRVKEVLSGQSAEAVGRTDRVTGRIDIARSTVTGGSFAVDMASVASDEARRDNQFRGRIMDVQTHPTATFTLTRPIDLPPAPAEGQPANVLATGDLTLRGTTKNVTVRLTAEREATSIRIAGSIPIVFGEWGIPNPSFGPAQTEDRGELEFRLLLTR